MSFGLRSPPTLLKLSQLLREQLHEFSFLLLSLPLLTCGQVLVLGYSEVLVAHRVPGLDAYFVLFRFFPHIPTNPLIAVINHMPLLFK